MKVVRAGEKRPSSRCPRVEYFEIVAGAHVRVRPWSDRHPIRSIPSRMLVRTANWKRGSRLKMIRLRHQVYIDISVSDARHLETVDQSQTNEKLMLVAKRSRKRNENKLFYWMHWNYFFIMQAISFKNKESTKTNSTAETNVKNTNFGIEAVSPGTHLNKSTFLKGLSLM